MSWRWVLSATLLVTLVISSGHSSPFSSSATSASNTKTTADETFWLQSFFEDEEIARYRAKFHSTATAPKQGNKKQKPSPTPTNKPSIYAFFEHEAIFNATEMYSENVTMIDLFDMKQVAQWCDLDRLPSESQRFTPCKGPLHNVLLWKTPFSSPNPYPPSGLTQYPSLLPHLFAIRDVFITWNGQIFDLSDHRPWKWPSSHHPDASLPHYSYPIRHYRHGGCADLSWASGWANITMEYFHRRIFYHTPILNLNHPYEGNVFHEVIEIYAQLFTYRPLLQRWPQMPIVMSARTYHTMTKYWPLLRWYGVLQQSLDELNIHYFHDGQDLVLAPYIITPVMGECCMLLPSLVTTLKAAIEANIPPYLQQEQEQEEKGWRDSEEVFPAFDGPMVLYERLKATESEPPTATAVSATAATATATISNAQQPQPNQQKQKKYIVLYDRGHDAYRRMLNADDVWTLLGERLAKPRGYHLRRFYGRNESLAQTVTWFHQAVLIVGVHGAGLTNILFAQPNTTVVEIRPENFAVTTIEHLGRSLGLRYHVFHCGRGRYRGPIPIKPYQLVDYLMPLVP